MKQPAESKQANDSFIAFLGSPHAWPVWVMFFYLLVALAIVMLATAAGLAFAASQRPQMPSAHNVSPQAPVSEPVIQHK